MKHLIQRFDYKNDKKKLLVICGIHGDETNAIATVMSVRDKIMRRPLSDFYGGITFIIGINEFGIRYNRRKHDIEYDPYDLNRMFHDNLDYKEIILKEIQNHDIVIDVHNSPNIENNVLITFDDYATGYKKFLDKNRITNMVWNIQTPNIKNKVNSYKDKLGFTVELNGLGDTSVEDSIENSDFLYKFIITIWQCKKTEEKPDPSIICGSLKPRYEGMIFWVNSRIFEQGETIALIMDYEGNTLEGIQAPYKCLVVAKTSSLFTRENGEIGNIIKLEA